MLDHGLYRRLDPEFVRNNALLWRSMACGDTEGVTSATAGMGTQHYKELLPLILTSRPVSSRVGFGQAIPSDEALDARKRVGFESGMSLAQFAEIAHDVPVDLLFVLRTMHLVRDLHAELGGTSRARLYAYAAAAAAFPDTAPPQTWSGFARLHAFEARVATHEGRLWFQRRVRAALDWASGASPVGDSASRFSLSGMLRERVERGRTGPGRLFSFLKSWRGRKQKALAHRDSSLRTLNRLGTADAAL